MCRKQRQAFGSLYSMDVFLECGPIYVNKGTSPCCSDLQELITLCEGTVTTTQKKAAIIISGDAIIQREDVMHVKETWVLDCITYNKKQSTRNYLIEMSE